MTCKEDLVGEVGQTARCDVVMSPTNSFEPVVTVTGVEGATINYEMTPALSKEQLARAVSRLLSATGGAPGDFGGVPVGSDRRDRGRRDCDVTTGGVTLRRTVVVTSVEGLMMNFDLIPVLTKDEVEVSLLDELADIWPSGRTPRYARATSRADREPPSTARWSWRRTVRPSR